MRAWTGRKLLMLSTATAIVVVLGAHSAKAEEGLASLHQVETAPSKLSIVDAAPALLPFFNNGPVFGIPGTVTGDFWQRTQATAIGAARVRAWQKTACSWIFIRRAPIRT